MILNNKGFAITTILYGLLVLFLFLFLSLLGILSQYKNNLEKLIENTDGARDIVTKKPIESSLTGVEMLISKANDVNIITYKDAATNKRAEMWAFNHPATEQVPATIDYRYIGSNPNNYITFNNEEWRIIGVFDNKIKLIKNTDIGNIPRDYKKSGVGSSTSADGSNDWSDSQLMYMLNPTTYTLKSGYTKVDNYIKDKKNNIIYQINRKPASIAAGATSYKGAENTWKLNETALNQVAITKYYLGGASSPDKQSAESYYKLERGNTVPSGRPTSWTGQVALMYPSDYAYTFAKGIDNTCYSDLKNCKNPSTSWLSNSNKKHRQTISPRTNSAYQVFYINYDGKISNGSSTCEPICNDHNYLTFPVVYLKSDIKLQGTGTSSEPYVIVG